MPLSCVQTTLLLIVCASDEVVVVNMVESGDIRRQPLLPADLALSEKNADTV